MNFSRQFLRYFVAFVLSLSFFVFVNMFLSVNGLDAEFGGVILIGFIPLVFGSSSFFKSPMLLVMLLVALFYLFIFAMFVKPLLRKDVDVCSSAETVDVGVCDDHGDSKINLNAGYVIFLGPIPIFICSGGKSAIIFACLVIILVFVFLILFTSL